jgi:hydroxyacid-oxoacid transhydrogenase
MAQTYGLASSDNLSDIVFVLQRVSQPNGLSEIGYTEADIPALVEGTLPQHRVTKLSPKEAMREDLENLFADAMKYW